MLTFCSEHARKVLTEPCDTMFWWRTVRLHYIVQVFVSVRACLSYMVEQ